MIVAITVAVDVCHLLVTFRVVFGTMLGVNVGPYVFGEGGVIKKAPMYLALKNILLCGARVLRPLKALISEL